jgi:hypothetical protein
MEGAAIITDLNTTEYDIRILNTQITCNISVFKQYFINTALVLAFPTPLIS